MIRPIVLVLVLLLAACSSASSNASSKQRPLGVTPTTIDYRGKYVRLVAPTDPATTTFTNAIDKLGNAPSGARVVALATPLAQTYRHLSAGLLAQHWPASAQASVKSLVADIDALVRDLNSASAQNARSASSWLTATKADQRKVAAAVAAVRGDLGLAPASG